MTVIPNILVVHGALGSALQMEPIARALDSLGTVQTVELPGHGSTPLAEGDDFSIETFARVLQSRAAGCAAPPVVFGYSMGGYAALALEAQHPGSLAGIVTLGTKFAWTPALALRECGRLDAKIIAEKIPKFATILAERHAGAGGWETMLQRTSALLTHLGGHPLLTQESLPRVQATVCIAVGEKDDTVRVDEAREYAAFIPRATSFMLADAPHPIERVSADAVVQLMRDVSAPSE